MSGFDNAAATYDRSRHALIPDYDDLYGAAVEALGLDQTQSARILDLGAGTGGFSQEVINAYPRSQVEMSDLSVPMLEQARTRFGTDPRVSFRELDIVTGEFGDDWDRIISSFVIHHLPHEAKREVFANVCAALKTGGIFVNIDQVQACSQAVQDIHMRLWKKDALAAGALQQDIDDGTARMEAMDINADLDDQVLWLKRAGFSKVDVIYRNYIWAVFVARKSA